jgi:ribosomal protein S18 acetylase RimI-like enzyme
MLDKNKISLRKANNSDIETLIEYWIVFLNEAQDNPLPIPESAFRQILRKYFEKAYNNDTFVFWIAEYDGKPIGFSGMVIREQPGNFEIPNGRTGYILNMFTLKEYRKNGIGAMLFQKLLEEGKSRKLDKIELHATHDGEPLYRKFGFKEPDHKALEIFVK